MGQNAFNSHAELKDFFFKKELGKFFSGSFNFSN